MTNEKRLTAKQVARQITGIEAAGSTGTDLKVLSRAAKLVRDNLVPRWQDEPDGDGWYWVLPLDEDRCSQYPSRFRQPRKIERSMGMWFIHIPEIGGGCEELNNRRVCPIGERPEETA